MSNRFFFLRGILGEATLLQEQQPAIDKLVRGLYGPGDLEKLRGHDVYSFRLNQEARLLFTIIHVKRIPCLLVLDYLPTHDYHKSRFLKSGVLKHYISRRSETFSDMTQTVNTFEPIDQGPFRTETPILDEAPQWRELDYYNEQLIELSPNQEQVLHIQLPALVSGEAGSGKSCIASALLSYHLQKQVGLAHEDNATSRILYVSKSNDLVRFVERTFNAIPKDEVQAIGVTFKTYHDLMLEGIEVGGKQIVDESTFATDWYENYAQSQKHAATDVYNELCQIGDEALYQEFRVCSGYTKDVYQQLGEKQSIYTLTQRAIIYAAFERYITYLMQHQLFNPELMSFSLPNQYDLVLADEAQDFSLLQLLVLNKLAKHERIAFFMDSHQHLCNSVSVRPYIIQQFNITPEQHIQLNTTYRCPLRIIQAANEVIALKHLLSGGLADKFESNKVVNAAQDRLVGSVYVCTPEELKQQTWLIEQAQKANFAIVTRTDLREAVKQLYATPLVFTPEEIKGLEFDLVLAYCLCEDDFFKEATRRYAVTDQENQPKHRAKAGQFYRQFIAGLNRIYTGYTRTKQALIICEPNQYYFRILLDRIRPLCNSDPISPACLQQEAMDCMDWLDEAQRQFNRGNRRIANDIFEMKLKQGNMSFDEFLALQGYPLVSASHSVDSPREPNRQCVTNSAASVTPIALAESTNSNRPMPSKNARNDIGVHEKDMTISSPAVGVVSDRAALSSAPKTDTTTQLDDVYKCMIASVRDNFSLKRYIAIVRLIPPELHYAALSYPFENVNPYGRTLSDRLIYEVISNQVLAPILNDIMIFLNTSFEVLIQPTQRLDSPFNKMIMELELLRRVANKQYKAKEIIEYNLQLTHLCLDLLPWRTNMRLIHQLGANWNARDSLGSPPLFYAAGSGNLEQVKLLCEFGADLTLLNDSQCSIMHVAAQTGRVKVIQFLKQCGVSLDVISVTGSTPFFTAVGYGQIEVLRAIIDLGGDIYKPDHKGWSPVHLAAQYGYDEILRLLNNLDFDIDAVTTDGMTPFLIAADCENINAMRMLKALKADINKGNLKGVTAAHFVLKGEKQGVHMLHELKSLGANIDIPNADGYTPLYVAVLMNQLDSVKTLLSMGADTQRSVKNGNRLPHLIAVKGDAKMLQFFNRFQLDYSVTNNQGVTPSDIAMLHKNKDVLDYLEKKGLGIESEKRNGSVQTL